VVVLFAIFSSTIFTPRILLKSLIKSLFSGLLIALFQKSLSNPREAFSKLIGSCKPKAQGYLLR
jgi:hypothetical protein